MFLENSRMIEIIFKILFEVSLDTLLKLLVRKIKDIDSKNKYSFVKLYKIKYISFKNKSQIKTNLKIFLLMFK